MEPRKIIKFGNSSFVLTLPTNWLSKNKLQKGDLLDICETNSNLVLSIPSKLIERTAEISIDDKPLKLFNKELISYYLKNFKFIKITGKEIINKLDQIKVFQEKLSSVELIEIDSDHVILKDLTSPDELNLQNIIEKIVHMEKVLFKELKLGISEENNDKHYLISQLDSNINKLTFLSYKSINHNLDTIKNPTQIKNSIYYWKIVDSFESIGDIIKRIARYLKNTEKIEKYSFFQLITNLDKYYNFVTNLLHKDINLENNLKLYLDKKQSILRELETLREEYKGNLNTFLVISQLLKDIIGNIDTVVLAIIDLNNN